MKRGGPLKRSDKPMAHGGLPAPTKAQKAIFDKLIDQVGCAVCLFHLRVEGSEGEIHHILVGGNRVSHDLVIPLCPTHHRGTNSGYICRHSVNGDDGGLAAFEAAYGNEYDLIEACERWINVDYSHNYNPDGLLTDEQAPQYDDEPEQAPISDDIATDTHADVEPDTTDGADAQEETTGFNSPVRINCSHYRHKLADPDGLSVKAAIDGFVKAGVLFDDTTKEIEEVSHRQIKIPRTEEECTVFEITEVA